MDGTGKVQVEGDNFMAVDEAPSGLYAKLVECTNGTLAIGGYAARDARTEHLQSPGLAIMPPTPQPGGVGGGSAGFRPHVSSPAANKHVGEGTADNVAPSSGVSSNGFAAMMVDGGETA